jgi:hypothetical protein
MDGTLFDDTQCEQDELADLVDFEASDEEVLSRIEHCVSAFLDELSNGRLQSIQTVQTAKIAAPVYRLPQGFCRLRLQCRSLEKAAMPTLDQVQSRSSCSRLSRQDL